MSELLNAAVFIVAVAFIAWGLDQLRKISGADDIPYD
jgi:hypothetical protein